MDTPVTRPDCQCGHPASYHINFAHEGKPKPPGPPDIPRKTNFCRHPTQRGFCRCQDYNAQTPTPPPPSETPKMTKYRRRNRTIEAITFRELVEYGIASGAELHRGMPWSFQYQGYPITHENDDCYLIPAPGLTMRFNRGDMLVVEKHQIYPLPPATFAYFYEPAGPDVL